jgi:hypothetical protein
MLFAERRIASQEGVDWLVKFNTGVGRNTTQLHKLQDRS